VPNGVDLVKVGKNYLILSGVEPVLLGNFITSIQRLRFPDAYKGKGFWKKYEKRTLKLFKKK
jgi:ribosomal protein L6P/L9E